MYFYIIYYDVCIGQIKIKCVFLKLLNHLQNIYIKIILKFFILKNRFIPNSINFINFYL